MAEASTLQAEAPSLQAEAEPAPRFTRQAPGVAEGAAVRFTPDTLSGDTSLPERV